MEIRKDISESAGICRGGSGLFSVSGIGFEDCSGPEQYNSAYPEKQRSSGGISRSVLPAGRVARNFGTLSICPAMRIRDDFFVVLTQDFCYILKEKIYSFHAKAAGSGQCLSRKMRDIPILSKGVRQ